MEWNQEEFGKRLKMLREEVGYTMLAFGKEIGTSASRIKHWEDGKSAPSASWIVKISDKFNVSVDDLLNGETKNYYATDHEDSVSSLFAQIAEEQAHYSVGHHEDIEELVDQMNSLKDRKYAGPEGREEIITEIATQLEHLTDQDLLEIRILVQLKKGYMRRGSFVI